MSLRDQWSGLFWVAISIFVCWVSIPIGIGTFKSPGPGFLPFSAGVVLGTLSVALVITSILQGKEEGRILSLWRGVKWHKVILVLTSLFIYTLLLPILGYLITTSGLLILLFGIKRKQRLWIQVLSALITAWVSYLIFYVWLEVQLPKGIFGS